jgi:hypothetical protein
MSESTCQSGSAWRNPSLVWIGWASICTILVCILFRVWDAFFIPWWFNTDEVVFYYEIIRQLRLEPTQTFFDIPGTPYMSLISLVTLFWWAAERVFRLTTAASPADFAFENIQQVYTLMRSITFGCYLLAAGLGYSVFRRASGVIVGTVAAVLTCTLPIHVQYSHFVRTESLGLVLCLAAILVVLHPRTRGKWGTYLAAGALAGAAAGARFHFALVGLPVLLAIYFFHDRATQSEEEIRAFPSKQLWIASSILAGFFVAGATATLLFKAGVIQPGLLTHTMLLTTPVGPEQYPGAKQAVAKLWLLLGSASLAAFVLHGLAAGRRLLSPILNPVTLALLLGFAGGFLLSHPTFLWRGEYQLRSIQFYSDWKDPNLEALGPFGRWWNVTRYYFTTALPEPWLQVLFLIGVVLVMYRRQPLSLAFLIGATICFVAHPVTMKLWPHHIIPWLPFLCYVAAYPVGFAIEATTRRLQQPAIVGLYLAVIVGLGATVSPRVIKADQYAKLSRARTDQITEMNHWVDDHVPADSFLVLSYYALNSDGFLKWIEQSGVSVPQHVKHFRDIEIWFLQRGTLDGKKGYVCVSKADIAFFRDDAERKNPGSTYNPFEDKRFEELAKFGDGFYELKVFEFDLRATQRP